MIFPDNRLRPYASYMQTIDEITALSDKCRIYLISAAREQERLGNFKAFGREDAIDKSELRHAISNGLRN